MARELGAELAARLDPGYPRGNPVALDPGGVVDGRRLGRGGADCEASRLDRPCGRGDRLEQLGGRAARARRPAAPCSAATRTCRRACRESPTSVGLYVGERFCRGASLPGRLGVLFGQNNDVAWSFTNVIADVMDLFIERIDGDALRVRRRAAPARDPSRRRSSSRGARSRSGSMVRETHHGPIVNEALARRRRRAAGAALDGARRPLCHRGEPRDLRGRERRGAGRFARAPRAPVSNLVWADRDGSIGYKMRRPGAASGAAAAPTCRSRAGSDELRVGGLRPVRGAARADRSRGRATCSRPTTGSLPRTTPHHIISD